MTEQEGLTIYGCNGTPVDCVKIAFDYLLQNGETPDLVLSGINHGANSAVNVLYSGTMGAAIEGSFYNIPSIGFSLLDHDEDADFGTVQQYILPIVRKAMTENLGRPLCLNVNVPNLPAEQIRGIMPCRQNRGYWREVFERRQDPRGHDYYWLCGYFENTEPEATDTDEWALKKRVRIGRSDPGGSDQLRTTGAVKRAEIRVETASFTAVSTRFRISRPG